MRLQLWFLKIINVFSICFRSWQRNVKANHVLSSRIWNEVMTCLPWWLSVICSFYRFGPNVLNGGIWKVRTAAVLEAQVLTPSHQSLVSGCRQNSGWRRPLSPIADHIRRECQLTSAEAPRTRVVRTGSPSLYHLSYWDGRASYFYLYLTPYTIYLPCTIPLPFKHLSYFVHCLISQILCLGNISYTLH